MDVNDDFRLEQELSGSESRRESVWGASCDTRQEIAAKTKQEEAKRTYRKDRGEEDGAQGKSGRGTARVGSAAVSAGRERPRGAVLPSIFGCCYWKKGGVHYVPDLPSESFLQKIQLDDSTAAHA